MKKENNLTNEIEKHITKIKKADIAVAIPSYNNAHTIGYVLYQVAKGLENYFPDKKAVIINVDGGSTDGCPGVANAIKLPIEKIVCVYKAYRGIYGKGSALRTAFEIADELDVEVFAMTDSDVRSINQEWIKLLIDPVYHDHCDFVAPHYIRYKYDGTITNFVTYPFIRMLFGKRIRQPIGGEFGLSKQCFKAILEHPLWKKPETPQYGIDIFLTSTALGEKFTVHESILGIKVHDAKDPALHLAPMFRQVVGSLFNAMNAFEDVWLEVTGSEVVHQYRGSIRYSHPEPFNVKVLNMIDLFVKGRSKYYNLLKSALPEKIFRKVISVPTLLEEYSFDSELWTDVAYNMTGAYFRSKDNREAILDAFRLMWMGRVADFTIESMDLNNREAEHLIEEQSYIFEEKKPTLVELYKNAKKRYKS